ncbi:unnamed protein product [Diatraea saccharalis]|uniref:Uncharacterized protein n=1 Tax=Diatraea saccharalis TaxID=40085 RepID=A0A9N9R632_9NEOP|nr:unnamed protein product [Diatraea saccharalis]
MVLKKCISCIKKITQKSPGLECSRCNKYVHATTTCANLTNKQLAALRNSEGLEWSCEDCLRNISRRSSYFLPDEFDNEEEIQEKNKTDRYDKLISQISCETRKIIKSELESLTTAVEYMNSQVSDLEHTVKQQDNTIKALVNKNSELIKKNQNLELRIDAMEQKLQEFDQKLLSTTLEIACIPEVNDKDALITIQKIAEKLKVSDQQI